jgi:hypothetical protein
LWWIFHAILQLIINNEKGTFKYMMLPEGGMEGSRVVVFDNSKVM